MAEDRSARSCGEFGAVVVAAGQGLRAGQPVPKQFAEWRGKPVLRHAVEAMRSAGAGAIAVVLPRGAEALAAQILAGVDEVLLVEGGATRQESVARGLEALAPVNPASVLIHDAARPDCPPQVVARLLAALDEEEGAIPVLPLVDSIVRARAGVMEEAERRDELWRVQTPQAFRFAAIRGAHRQWAGPPDAGDDAQVLAAAGGTVRLVEGDERLRKLTFAEDFAPAPAAAAAAAPSADAEAGPPLRVGTGFDVHRLAEGEELWLCGVRIPHDRGLAGHSDADVALHALVDAILGAAGAGDIGLHFPPSDARWKGADSAQFLRHAVSLAATLGFRVGNVDVTLICESPRLSPHRETMRARLAELLALDRALVSVKATTTERLGFTGRGEGIAAQAVATLWRR